MEKLLFYGNEWGDFKSFLELITLLEKEGFEVAVATNNIQLIPPLSVGKLLTVTPNSYHCDVCVVMDNKIKLKGKNCIFWSELKEMVRR